MPGASEDVVHLAGVVALLRARWRVVAAATAGGLALGGALALTGSPTYSAGSQVLIQDEPKEDRVVAEARIAESMEVLKLVADTLSWGKTPAQLADQVSASSTDGNIIRITATANSPERARQLAEATTEQYLVYSTGLLTRTATASVNVLLPRRESLNKQLEAIDARTAELKAKPEITDPNNPTGISAHAELQELEGTRVHLLQEVADLEGDIAQAQANSVAGAQHFAVIDRPRDPTSAASASRIVRTVEFGLAGFVLAGIVLVVRRHRDRRLYLADDIARAVGAPLLGVVSPPGKAAPAKDGAVPELEELRYRRFLARLTAGQDPDGAGDPTTVVLVTTEADGPADRALTHLRDLAGGAVTLVVVTAPPGQPALPDQEPGTRPILVVTAGTRTAGQLQDLAAACHDAGAPPLGALVITPDGAGPLVERIPVPAVPQ